MPRLVRPSSEVYSTGAKKTPAHSYLSLVDGTLMRHGTWAECEGRVKGLKLYPGYEPFYPHDKRLKVVYDLAEEFDVPVMVHSGDTYSPKGKLKYAHPLEIDEVAVDHPKVKFVICHLGNPWLTDAMEVVYKNANVYADISGLMLGEFSQAFEDYMNDEIEDVITYAGEPEKFLFGTDWPICSMKSYVDFVGRLEISARDRHLMLYENSRRIFKLPLPPRTEEPHA
jgi:predicted TIM-barrel fold metal-dependent hydrolase